MGFTFTSNSVKKKINNQVFLIMKIKYWLKKIIKLLKKNWLISKIIIIDHIILKNWLISKIRDKKVKNKINWWQWGLNPGHFGD